MNFESEAPSSQRNRSYRSNGPGNMDEPITNRSKSDKEGLCENDHRPIIAPGELREMVNKRSESANRKYRAFKHFIKYHNAINKPDPKDSKKDVP